MCLTWSDWRRVAEEYRQKKLIVDGREMEDRVGKCEREIFYQENSRHRECLQCADSANQTTKISQ